MLQRNRRTYFDAYAADREVRDAEKAREFAQLRSLGASNGLRFHDPRYRERMQEVQRKRAKVSLAPVAFVSK